MPPDASRLLDALAHLTALGYTPRDLFHDLLHSTGPEYEAERADLRAHALQLVPLLVPAARTKLDACLLLLAHSSYSVPSLVMDLLESASPEAIAVVPDLMSALSSGNEDGVASWAVDMCLPVYEAEMRKVCDVKAGFQAGASTAQPEQVEGFSIPDIAAKLRELAPRTWALLSRIIDARGTLRRALAAGGTLGPAELWIQGPGDLGAHDDRVRLDSNEDDEMDEDEAYWSEVDAALDHADALNAGNVPPMQAPAAIRAPASKALVRHSGLSEAKIVSIFGVAMNSTNRNCNAIQLIFGTLLRMKHVPDVVVNVLNHIGITVSNKSMDRAVKSLANAEAKLLVRRGASKTSQKAFDNFNFMDPVATPTVDRASVYRSMISALDISSHPSLTPEHFKFVDLVWETNPAITIPRQPGQQRPFEPTYEDILGLAAALDPRPPETADSDGPTYLERTNSWQVREVLVRQHGRFKRYADCLGEPERVQRIEPHKTDWSPMRAMNLNQSQTGDTIEAVLQMFLQTGITDDIADDYVTFVHGDLGGSERLQSAQLFRSLEKTSTEQLRSVLDVPGLFHTLMASEDAIFRLFVLPKESRFDTPKGLSSIYKYVEQLLPKSSDHLKFTSASPGPTFRRGHDTFTYIMWAFILEAWTLSAAERNPVCLSLDLFADELAKLPKDEAWKIIVELSQKIAKTYVAGPSFHEEREQPDEKRDKNFENNRLFLSLILLHTDLNYSIKIQDIGRVVQALCLLILIWAAAKKHKYSSHMRRVLVQLTYVWPPLLKEAFLTSWTINPTGKPEGGRGVDWLVELFNMYLKVVHSGASSNFGINEMIKVSPLIKLYKIVFENFAVNYYMLGRTVKHARPDMTDTIEHLRRTMHEDKALVHIPGRSVPYEAPDAISVGLHMYQTGKAGNMTSDAARKHAVDLDDFDI